MGGRAYGSLYSPVDTGSRGGGIHGGLGGGKVYIKSPAILLLDGNILVDGADGTNTDGGGGSGGAIFIEAGKMFSQGGRVTNFLGLKLLIFSYPSLQTFVMRVQKNLLIEMVLVSTHNKCFD